MSDALFNCHCLEFLLHSHINKCWLSRIIEGGDQERSAPGIALVGGDTDLLTLKKPKSDDRFLSFGYDNHNK